jgi:hypothetical protein
MIIKMIWVEWEIAFRVIKIDNTRVFRVLNIWSKPLVVTNIVRV